MTKPRLTLAAALLALATADPLSAQTFPTDYRVIRNMWTQGMGAGSQIYRLAQALLDSIGPRLTGTAGQDQSIEWALKQYAEWGIPARKEQYGTWMGWRRGHTVLELTAPRYRQLQGLTMAYSVGTVGPVEGDVVVLPDLPNQAAFDSWLVGVQDKFVMVSAPQQTCRPDENLTALARPETVERIFAEQDSVQLAWARRFTNAGKNLGGRLDASGAAAVLSSYWSGGWGVNKVHDAQATQVPMLDVSCEDYGLLYRLAAAGQGPRVRLGADAEFLGERPVFNVIAEIRGNQLPDEYVMLSAHFDSWDAASGAADNGTGTLTMMEAMRILRETYPRPRRTILVGHWGGEEQGLNGSAAFAEDHPKVVAGTQVGFNQDNGTWRIEAIRMQGFDDARDQVARWLSQIPGEISDTVQFESPIAAGSSDEISFHCRGAPVWRLQSNYPDYRQYTWHTNLDTFDKIIFDDLKNNATLAAMLAYLASEDPMRVSRVRSPLPPNAQGQVLERPACGTPRRSWGR